MTHHESIRVYKLVLTPDGYGGTTEVEQLEGNAPKVATVRNTKGGSQELSLRAAGDNLFDVITNWRSDFIFDIGHRIDTRFGRLEVIGVRETVRRREVMCTCRMNSEKWQAV
jgi:hypothetical protein